MAKGVVAGLDIGNHTICVVVGEKEKGDMLSLVSLVKHEARGLHKGAIMDFADVVSSIEEAVAKAERQCGKRIKGAYVSISGASLSSHITDGSVIISRADSEIADLDVQRALDTAEGKINDLPNLRIHDVIPLSYKLDNKKIQGDPIGMKGAKLEVRSLFTTSSLRHSDEVISAVEQASISILDMLPSPLASSLVTANRTQKIAGCILVDIGAQVTTCTVFEEGLPHLITTIDIGSQDITNDIALGMKVDLEEAEKIKLGEASKVYPQKKLDDIIQARLSDIFELIETQLKKIGRNELLPAGIILCGGGALLPKIDVYASEYLNLPAKVALPLYPQNMRLDKDAEEQPPVFVKDPSYATAYGLVLFGMNPTKKESAWRGGFSSQGAFSTASKWLKHFLP